jgi:hypothetical protein
MVRSPVDKVSGGELSKSAFEDEQAGLDADSNAVAFVMMVPELEMPSEKVDKETKMAVKLPRSSE